MNSSNQTNVSFPSYHTQHAPFGAFASFNLGLVGKPGGFAQSAKRPDQICQNVYVGFRSGEHAAWNLLPYFVRKESAESAFTGQAARDGGREGVITLKPEEFQRTLGWASDTWNADQEKFTFSLSTPFFKVPAPQTLSRKSQRFYLAPVVTAWIEYDNRKSKKTAQLIFGIGDSSRPHRPLQDTVTDKIVGFASADSYGFATPQAKHVECRQALDIFARRYKGYRDLHILGGESALVFTVPPGKRMGFPITLGFYQGGIITTGIPSNYAYSRVFNDLEDVLAHGLTHHTQYVAAAKERDRELESSQLTGDQKFFLAQATHSYYGSTQLLWSKSGPLWVVNEGEYRMINTFDLTVDHLFFELEWHPWAVRDTLDLFVDRYSFVDELKAGTGHARPGGISFVHDMGVMNHFTPKGESSYECQDQESVFGHMTMEQLLNWTICATVYAEKKHDWAWLRQKKKILLACAKSLHLRDHPQSEFRNGILKYDSARCGLHGSEITTYDSLDVSLGQARNNLYIAIKTLAAWVLLEKAFIRLSVKNAAIDAKNTADLIAQTLEQQFEEDTGFFPAVFEKKNKSRILPAVEGFVYPLYLGYDDITDRSGRFARLLTMLESHVERALQPGVCLDEKTGAWKISSTSKNTWPSKVAISQYVIRQLFLDALSPAAWAADSVHAEWQRQPGCGADAMCDQVISDTGVSCGSRYYPRGVTSFLWLSE